MLKMEARPNMNVLVADSCGVCSQLAVMPIMTNHVYMSCVDTYVVLINAEF